MAETPSIRTSILRIVRGALPWLDYCMPRTYVVRSANPDNTLDLVPPPNASGLPELPSVEQWVLGKVTPAPGSRVIVVFREARQDGAVVVGYEAGRNALSYELQTDQQLVLDGTASTVVNASNTLAGVVVLGSPAAIPPPKPAARLGDAVGGGVITSGSTKVVIQD